MKNLGVVVSRFLSILLVLQLLGNTVVLTTYLALADPGPLNKWPPNAEVIVLLAVITVQFALAFLLWTKSDRFVSSNNLGAIGSRALSVLILGQVLSIVVAAPNFIGMAQSTREPGEAGRHSELIVALLIVAFEVALSVVLWLRADRFVPSGTPPAGVSVDLQHFQRLLFCVLGVYLLAGSLSSLATELGAVYSRFAPLRSGAHAWMPTGWTYLSDVLRALIGLGLVLFNRPIRLSNALRQAANLPRNDAQTQPPTGSHPAPNP